MPNIKSAKKAVKTIERKRVRNQGVRSAIKTAVKKATVAVAKPQGSDPKDAVKAAARLLDKAATKGIVHKNTAARKKSRLMKKLNAATAASA